MAEHRNIAIPNRAGEQPVVESQQTTVDIQNQEGDMQATQVKEETPAPLSKEESEIIEKVFFEEDESVRLRDGISYKIPPLGLLDAKNLMKKLNTIDTGVIITNLIADDEGKDSYEELLDVLLMAFKPYYPNMTAEYLGKYVDIVSAKEIIDIMIGLNGLKKSL
ncbi:DNA polymerase III subunit gamma/tau [Bacillus inaquosorum]|uniref:DNA polymerase III subunit gamma/tau n=2 Tax=Bacteria TaxID=2 RepID=UPI0013208475|nr:DNA polymerase III subunit gamma/tau [Bacillus inaquosorum]MUG00767.1 DNA polymerase III subunit gamma/tau [Bacillus tequilensis]WNW25068.1 DNA polymerase III subunit gamma/tau [Bacillus inaquosorum]